MSKAFSLASYDDVKMHAGIIYDRIRGVGASIMPPPPPRGEGPWPPRIPFWRMVFRNTRAFFLSSDDFPKEAKLLAAEDLNAALQGGWSGFEIGEKIRLAEIARAQELVQHPVRPGRIVAVL